MAASRQTYRLLAESLSAMRAETYCDPQVRMLDRLIDDLCDRLWEDNQRFDSERFKTQARYCEDRMLPDWKGN